MEQRVKQIHGLSRLCFIFGSMSPRVHKFLAACFALVVCFGFSTDLYAQNKTTSNKDSLLSIWNDESGHDTVRLKALIKIIQKHHLFTNPDSSLFYADLGFEFAKQVENLFYMASTRNFKGISYSLKGENSKAVKFWNESLEIYQEIDDQKGLAGVLNNLGIVYQDQGNLVKALDYYQQSISLYKSINYKKGLTSSLSNMGRVYLLQKNHEKAFEYLSRVKELHEELGDEQGIAGSYNDLANVLFDQKKYEKAEEYFRKGLEMRKRLGYQRGVANSLSGLGNFYKQKKEYEKAVSYFMQSKDIWEELGMKKGWITAHYHIGSTRQKQERNQDAIIWCNKAKELASEAKLAFLEKESCRCLYRAYKAIDQSDSAMLYLEYVVHLDDSINKQETVKKLEQIEFAKQVQEDSLKRVEEKRAMEEAHMLEVQKKNRSRNQAIAAGMFLLLLSLALYNRMQYVRKAKKAVEAEKERSEHLLLNILPAEIAEELKEKGEAEARHFQEVSIMFTDFVGFTQIAEQMNANELVEELNICFKEFDKICEEYGIEKIKTIGDAYMAAGGLPVPQNDSTEKTVRVALKMINFLLERKEQRLSEGKPVFEVRIGIHTGPVVAGIVGVKKFQYDVWGDTVNTAARLESSGEAGKVNISRPRMKKLLNQGISFLKKEVNWK